MKSIMEKAELRTRVEAEEKRLKDEIEAIRNDKRKEAREQLTNLRNQVLLLNEILKNGWEDVTEDTAVKLEQWLGARSRSDSAA